MSKICPTCYKNGKAQKTIVPESAVSTTKRTTVFKRNPGRNGRIETVK